MRKMRGSRAERTFLGAAGVFLLSLLAVSAAEAQTFDWNLPLGFPTPKVPQSNPISAEKVTLGRRLFYDKRLSGNQTFACASCHKQESAFTDGLLVAVGSTGQMHPRNSMSLTNAGFVSTLAWGNPLLRRLEDQIPIPMFGEQPVELGLAGLDEELIDRLSADVRYRQLFAAAFPTESEPINRNNIVRGIASFVRTLISGNSPYDRYQFGLDDNAITPSAIHGAELFFSERFECFHCHGGFNFSASVDFEGNPFDEITFFNNALYNIGGTGDYPPNNIGIKEFTGRREDMGHFKAPTLRNIAVTAPYMHDGSIATLDEVLDHYAAGGRTITEGPYAGVGSETPFKSMFLLGFTMTEEERADIVHFLESLTDEEFLNNPDFSDPFPSETPIPSSCIGDCDDSGMVAVNELVKGVNIALARDAVASCPQFDTDASQTVTVNELVMSVNAAVHGCVE
jgi:cytochrome c peroxidase